MCHYVPIFAGFCLINVENVKKGNAEMGMEAIKIERDMELGP